MDQMQIDRDDIEVLLRALDSYEKEAGSDGMLRAMLGGVLLRQKDKSETSLEQYFENEKQKAETETAARRERVIMLKAKLLMWRDRVEAKEFSDGALKKSGGGCRTI